MSNQTVTPDHRVHIRAASPDEAATLTEIAHAAKRLWGYPEEWIARWREALTLTVDYVAAHEVFVGEYRRQIAGFYALVPLARDEAKWELEHLWVRPELAGRGLGRALLRHAVQRVGALSPGAALEIEADPNAEGFYLRMGAARIGEIVRDWAGQERRLPHLRIMTAEPR